MQVVPECTMTAVGSLWVVVVVAVMTHECSAVEMIANNDASVDLLTRIGVCLICSPLNIVC